MIDKNLLKKDFDEYLAELTDGEKPTAPQLHDALARSIMKQAAPVMAKSAPKGRSASYFSAEFLVGRAVYNNLMCLGLLDDAEALLNSAGASLCSLEEIEDAALGNGGLGRLAACFLDSAASMKLPLTGYGIRYKYGLFKQSIVDGFQKEDADDWTKFGDPWSKRVEKDAVKVHFSTGDVMAIPYDMPIFGYKNGFAGTLRLWQAEPVKEFDFDAFNRQDYMEACRAQIEAENISRTLYPNDDARPGKLLRLKQQYFFCAASLHDLLKKHLKAGRKIEDFAEYNSIQLNDTHPTISIPELIRLLMTEYGVSFEKSLEIAQKTFNYTNHTIMPEALEKWGTDLMEELLPQVYSVILRINEAFIADMYRRNMPREQIDQMKMVSGGVVHMAKMAIYCSSCTNGVARIHTEILKHNALPEWYELYPERFQNKTNGITPRRWIALCNPELSAQITDLLGDEGWITDLSRLKELEKYAGDPAQLDRFSRIKSAKKATLAEYIAEHDRTAVDADSIFDIQIKRLHEYKRQQLNAMNIIADYNYLLQNPDADFVPKTYIFASKAAPGYYIAKQIIKMIWCIGEEIKHNPKIREKLSVVFLEDYRVTLSEILMPAAEVSEQISLAGTEASGTGNMKLMLNGALTLGTYDGANVEIHEAVGTDNIFIFGMRTPEVNELRMKGYHPEDYINNSQVIRDVMARMYNGINGATFEEVANSIRNKDFYMALADFDSYRGTQHYISEVYRNQLEWNKKSLYNIAGAGRFSADRAVTDYARDIWNLK